MEAEPLALGLFAVKLGLYGSTLLAAGLALHAGLNVLAIHDRPRAMRTAAVAGLIALILAALRIGLANAQIGGGGAILDLATMSWTWPALGPSSTSIAFGAVAILIAWRLRSGIAAILAACALAVSFSLTGHSQALDPPGLAPWAVAVHVLIGAFWFAGPVTLWPARGLDDALLTARVAQFSARAVAAIPFLFALGLWLALLLAGGIGPLLASPYGQLLLAKLAAGCVALALGAYNKTVITAQLQSAPLAGRRALKTTLGLDVFLFLIALGSVAAATSLTGPPTP